MLCKPPKSPRETSSRCLRTTLGAVGGSLVGTLNSFTLLVEEDGAESEEVVTTAEAVLTVALMVAVVERERVETAFISGPLLSDSFATVEATEEAAEDVLFCNADFSARLSCSSSLATSSSGTLLGRLLLPLIVADALALAAESNALVFSPNAFGEALGRIVWILSS